MITTPDEHSIQLRFRCPIVLFLYPQGQAQLKHFSIEIIPYEIPVISHPLMEIDCEIASEIAVGVVSLTDAHFCGECADGVLVTIDRLIQDVVRKEKSRYKAIVFIMVDFDADQGSKRSPPTSARGR